MNSPKVEAKITVELLAAPPASDVAIAPGEIADELGADALAENEQPTTVLPEQSTVVLETPTLKRRAIRLAKAAAPLSPIRPVDASALPSPAPSAIPTRASIVGKSSLVPDQVQRFVAARPWLWVVALLICVCILALVSRQIGG